LYIAPETEYKCRKGRRRRITARVRVGQGPMTALTEMGQAMGILKRGIGCLSVAAPLALLPLLASCNSQSFALDDGIPNTAPPAVISQSKTERAPGPLVKKDTGTYPTFDRTLLAANEQIEDEDYNKSEPRMAALARARRSGSISEAEYKRRVAEYRKLAADHGTDALNDISK